MKLTMPPQPPGDEPGQNPTEESGNAGTRPETPTELKETAFALAVEVARSADRTCAECGGMLPIGARADVVTCGTTCRSKRHRRRAGARHVWPPTMAASL